MKMSKLSRLRVRCALISSAIVAGSAVSAVPVSAMTQEEMAKLLIGAIIKVITRIARLVGIFLIVYGVISFITALRNEDVENKHRASIMVVVGIALVLIDPLLKLLNLDGLLSGAGGSSGSSGGAGGAADPAPVDVSDAIYV